MCLTNCQRNWKEKHGSLYRDDRLAILKNCTGRLADKARKELSTIFETFGLKITWVADQKIVNFLDITFNLHNNYRPYRKPNDDPLLIHSQSNHPSSITKQLPKTINKRISTPSSYSLSFDAAAPLYEEALRRNNFNVKLKYNPEDEASPNRPKNQRNRYGNIIWYNSPFSKNVRSNIGRNFLILIDKHFPPTSNLHKTFNQNTMKISYSCMGNMRSTISKQNFRILAKTKSRTIDTCNCRRKDECPLPGKCQTTNVTCVATG